MCTYKLKTTNKSKQIKKQNPCRLPWVVVLSFCPCFAELGVIHRLRLLTLPPFSSLSLCIPPPLAPLAPFLPYSLLSQLCPVWSGSLGYVCVWACVGSSTHILQELMGITRRLELQGSSAEDPLQFKPQLSLRKAYVACCWSCLLEALIIEKWPDLGGKKEGGQVSAGRVRSFNLFFFPHFHKLWSVSIYSHWYINSFCQKLKWKMKSDHLLWLMNVSFALKPSQRKQTAPM